MHIVGESGQEVGSCLSQQHPQSTLPQSLKKGRVYFLALFGVFLSTTPHLDNVTDNHRYSRLLAVADFSSVGVVIILVRFL